MGCNTYGDPRLDQIGVLASMNKDGWVLADDLLDEAETRGYDRELTKADLERLRREGRVMRNAKNQNKYRVV